MIFCSPRSERPTGLVATLASSTERAALVVALAHQRAVPAAGTLPATVSGLVAALAQAVRP